MVGTYGLSLWILGEPLRHFQRDTGVFSIVLAPVLRSRATAEDGGALPHFMELWNGDIQSNLGCQEQKNGIGLANS